jgi:hypothetical protein
MTTMPLTITRTVDDLTVTVRATDTMRVGHHEEPGVIVTVYDPILTMNALYDTDYLPLVTQRHPAPGRERFEPETINQIGRPGAYRFVWRDDWEGDWLDARIAEAVAEAQTIIAGRGPALHDNVIVQAVADALHRTYASIGIEPTPEQIELATERALIVLAEDDDDRPSAADRARLAEIDARPDEDIIGLLDSAIRGEIQRPIFDGLQIDALATMTARRIERASGAEYRPLVWMRTSPERAADLRAHWGGSISRETMTTGGHSPRVRWEITGQPLERLLRAVLPAIHAQRAQAETLLALRTTIAAAPRTGRGVPLPAEHVAQLDALVERLRDLNQAGTTGLMVND